MTVTADEPAVLLELAVTPSSGSAVADGDVGSSGTVVAQTEELAPVTPAFYTCTAYDTALLDQGAVTTTDDGYQLRGLIATTTGTGSDPRVNGPGIYELNQDTYDGTPWGMGSRWGSSRQENESGGWEGTYFGAMVPTVSSDPIYVIVGQHLGTGDYEGLSMIDITTFPDGPGGRSVCQGVIYEGPLPQNDFVEPPPIE